MALNSVTSTTRTGSGGYTPPTTGASGTMQDSQGLPFYQGQSIITHIPAFQRDYNLRDALITKIKEGRDNLLKMLLAFAKANGAFVTTDVQSRWYIEHQTTKRYYLKVKTNQGGTTGSSYNTGTFTLDTSTDAKTLQVGDHLSLMCVYLPTSRNTNGALLDYTVNVSGGSVYQAKKVYTTPLPEIVKVSDINYETGTVTVVRNVGGDSQTVAAGSRQAPAFTVCTTATSDPGTNIVNQSDAFFIKMGNAMAEGRDDQMVWSLSNTWDYNYCQYVLRKWGATDIEQNVLKRGLGGEKTMQRNSRLALESFYDELEWLAMFGIRKEESDVDDRWIGHAGGILEFVPQAHYVEMVYPTYTSITSLGDFTISKFNKKFENCFYYGNQTKVMVAGQNWFTAFSTMINTMTQNVPTIVKEWEVEAYKFKTSSGGTIIVAPSDKLSLNGMSDCAILLDPEHFVYGHLQNMDINVNSKLPTTNIHEETGEVYGVVTFKRTNPDAHWVFVGIPNTSQS